MAHIAVGTERCAVLAAAGAREYAPVNKPILSRIRNMMRKGMDEGQKVLQGLLSSRAPLTNLERALSTFRQELAPKDAARLRIVVAGQAR